MTSVHIHAPKGQFFGQVRRYGHQRWESVGSPCKTAKGAMVKAIKAMGPYHKRARVLLCAEWYDPNVVMELSV